MTAEHHAEARIVLGPAAVPALVLIAVGWRRRRPVFVFAGALMLGRALKIASRGAGAAADSPHPPASPAA